MKADMNTPVKKVAVKNVNPEPKKTETKATESTPLPEAQADSVKIKRFDTKTAPMTDKFSDTTAQTAETTAPIKLAGLSLVMQHAGMPVEHYKYALSAIKKLTAGDPNRGVTWDEVERAFDFNHNTLNNSGLTKEEGNALIQLRVLWPRADKSYEGPSFDQVSAKTTRDGINIKDPSSGTTTKVEGAKVLSNTDLDQAWKDGDFSSEANSKKPFTPYFPTKFIGQ